MVLNTISRKTASLKCPQFLILDLFLLDAWAGPCTMKDSQIEEACMAIVGSAKTCTWSLTRTKLKLFLDKTMKAVQRLLTPQKTPLTLLGRAACSKSQAHFQCPACKVNRSQHTVSSLSGACLDRLKGQKGHPLTCVDSLLTPLVNKDSLMGLRITTRSRPAPLATDTPKQADTISNGTECSVDDPD